MTEQVTNLEELKAALYEDFNAVRARASEVDAQIYPGNVTSVAGPAGTLRLAEAQIAANIIALEQGPKPKGLTLS